MEASSSSVVIKVKHGDSLRRFKAQISGNDELGLTMDSLRNKIISLFSFDPDTHLMLTYIDDVVTLADEDDLRDAVKQGLKPLRITVKVGAEKNGHGVPGIFKTLPVPLTSSSDLVVDRSAKAGTTLDHLSQLQLGGVDSSSTDKGISEKSKGLAKAKAAVENNEMILVSLSGLTMQDSSENSGPVYSHPDYTSPEPDKKIILLKSFVDKVSGMPYLAPFQNSIGEGARPSIRARTGSSPFPLLSSKVDRFRRIIRHNDYYTGNIFHRGISCDCCGVLTITGPRFKSKNLPHLLNYFVGSYVHSSEHVLRNGAKKSSMYKLHPYIFAYYKFSPFVFCKF